MVKYLFYLTVCYNITTHAQLKEKNNIDKKQQILKYNNKKKKKTIIAKPLSP